MDERILTLKSKSKNDLINNIKEKDLIIKKLVKQKILLNDDLEACFEMLEYYINILKRIDERLIKFSKNHRTVTKNNNYETPHSAIFAFIGHTLDSDYNNRTRFEKIKKRYKDFN